jgi:uncharacterized protein (TIGR00297 family)
MTDEVQLLLGVVLGATMAAGGYWKQALSRSGAAAAAIVGAVVFGLGGWAWGLLLVAFFVSSSLLSYFNPAGKAAVAAEKFDKGSRRDWAQVAANGGWVTLLALLMWQQPGPGLYAAMVGALATVTADTWATEIGTLSRQPPRLVTTGREVPPGTSGGITVLGTVASLAGSLFIGMLSYTLATLGGAPLLAINPLWLPLVAMVGGVGGAFTDSLLGATVQRLYYCPRCNTETERVMHRCGTVTHPLRGWRWMDNDMVNFLSSVAGSVLALWLAIVLL